MKTLFFILASMMAFNSEASILCHTPRMNKIFEIKEQKITFYNEFDSTAHREIASVLGRSKPSSQGFTKVVDFENQKHTIHIDNPSEFSDINDYLIIKAKSGHEVVYPITCKNR